MVYKGFLLVLIFLTNSLQAGFFDGHAEGWHWYQNLLVLEEEKEDETFEKTEPFESGPKQTRKNDPNELMKAYRGEIERRLNLALINPSPFNVQRYQAIQKDLMNRSERFSKIWQRTLLENPALDHSVEFPTSQVSRHVYLDEQRKEKAEKIKALSGSYGLFFFYRGNCPYCHAFAPIVKRFAETYHWDVLAISLDGSSMLEFPDAKTDQGQAAQLGVGVVPSLFAVNPQTGHILPISHGMTTQDEIENHILVLTEAP
ncbi:MAG: type-F conjugative transfer system pilin assembly protein TraF [Alphaproteobacteria bacterium]|nr:type-F conjugative transfer system pilin assembly protein TraF [Alphaproteobacteria bacterium]